jgi:hypothetical protein
MAQQSPPGVQMYEAEWQLDGKGVVRLYIHAANEADALTQAEDFFTRLLAHPYRHIAPSGEGPKVTESGDALVEHADMGQAQADEPMTQASEQVTPSASNPKATESANGLIEPADERLARETEQISEPESDAVQDPSLVPGRPSVGRPALRGLIGLLLAASIFVAAFVSQSSHIDPAKLAVVRWAAQPGTTSSEPLNQSERREPRGAAQPNAAESMASQLTPSPQTAPQGATALLSLDQAQMLHVIARDLAKLGQRIEELNTRQEQMAGGSAKPDLAQILQAMAPDLTKLGQRIEELNTRQEQMAGENAKAIEQLTASQDQLARGNIKAIHQLERTQEQVARDNAKTAEQIKAGREQMARFLAARASEQSLQPKTPAPESHPIAAPKR